MSRATLCVLALIVATVLAQRVEDGGHIETRHSFQPPYSGSSIKNFRLGGSAVATNEFVRLTPAVNDRAGWIWNAHGITVPDWRVTVEFRVHGEKNGADGWAFWAVARPTEIEGPVYGLEDKWRGIVVSMDTFDNDGRDGNPLISVNEGDGSTPFSIMTDGHASALGSCVSAFRNLEQPSMLRVTKAKERITVEFMLGYTGGWHMCVDNVPLQDPNRGLTFFGISARTGGLNDNHDIISFVTEFLSHEEGENIANDEPAADADNLTPRERRLREQQRRREEAAAARAQRVVAAAAAAASAAAAPADAAPQLAVASVPDAAADREPVHEHSADEAELDNRRYDSERREPARAAPLVPPPPSYASNDHASLAMQRQLDDLSNRMASMQTDLANLARLETTLRRIGSVVDALDVKIERHTSSAAADVQAKLQSELTLLRSSIADVGTQMKQLKEKSEVLTELKRLTGDISNSLNAFRRDIERLFSLSDALKDVNQRALTELERRTSGLGGWFWTLVVVAQVLLLVIFVLFKTVSDRRRGHYL